MQPSPSFMILTLWAFQISIQITAMSNLNKTLITHSLEIDTILFKM